MNELVFWPKDKSRVYEAKPMNICSERRLDAGSTQMRRGAVGRDATMTQVGVSFDCRQMCRLFDEL